METWKRLAVTRGDQGRGQWCKEAEGNSHRICINDPRTWAMLWGLTVGARWSVMGRGGQRGKIETTVIE